MIPPHILIAEDDPGLADSLREALELSHYTVTCVEDGDFALDLIEHQNFDLVLTDYQMKVMDGIELLAAIKEAKPNLPVIIMTAHNTPNLAILASKSGAFDYLVKPFEVSELLDTLTHAITPRSTFPTRPSDITRAEDAHALLGSSRGMQAIFKEIGRLADKPVPVLIRGETGTGKELVARAIHRHSRRHGQPFIAINCAAVPETLIESELFGHEKGAFTNATSQRLGRFEQAQGGTLFLDEIGDLPWQTQVKLLRVLQEKAVQRVGGRDEIIIDVRIISATHRDLEQMIIDGSFRNDLYFRLNATSLSLPPLRDRLQDLHDLVPHMLRKYADEFSMPVPHASQGCLHRLSLHPWPGNIRELENVIRRALIECRNQPLSPDLISRVLAGSAPTLITQGEAAGFRDYIRRRLVTASHNEKGSPPLLADLIEEMEHILYQEAVSLSHGNQTNMAKWIGVSRLTVREKLDKYQLFPRRPKRP